MSLPQIQEKDNRFGLASEVEAAKAELISEEKNDSTVNSSWSRAQAQSLGAHSRRLSRSRSRSKSPGHSTRRRLSRSRSRSRSRTRIPAHGQDDAFRPQPSDHSHGPGGGGPHSPPRPSMSSLKSRGRSPDAPAHPRVTFTEETQERPKYDRAPASSREVPRLDRDDPGDWVIRHHRTGLVVRLEEYRPSKIQSTLDAMKEMLQNVPGLGESKGKTKKEENLPVSTTTSETSSSEAATATTKAKKPLDNKRFRISFAEVQRMKIRKLQCQLVRHVVKMRYEGHESPGWEDTLEQYIKALQDHDYMEQRSKSIRDPFLATGEFSIDNYILNSNINTILANDPTIEPASSIFPWEPHDSSDTSRRFEPICGTRSDNISRTWYLGFKDRILLAALGGAFLIGPMWLMVLHNGELTGLVATTGFVTVFGIIMAYFLDEGKDVLASTAAYAAVLVVFVGTSTSSPSPESA